jgi:hypothetical protein
MMDVGFIGGFGRSGSTLLERIIAELPGVCALGEVLHLWQRGVRDNELCACGQHFHECPFWRMVGEEAFGGWRNVDVDAVIRMHDRVDRTRFIPGDLVSGKLSARHAQSRAYADYFARVYAAAAKVSGAQIVVDSSKNASTAYALRAHDDVALRVLHVIRDSRGVAYSWTKKIVRPEASESGEHPWMQQYPPWASALLWDAQNLAFEALGRTGVPVYRVFYERFLAAPPESLSAIAEFLGLDFGDSAGFLGGRTVRLGSTHQVNGNPMRFRTGEMQLRADEAWRAEFPKRSSRLVTALTAPVMLRYGYGLSTRADRAVR